MRGSPHSNKHRPGDEASGSQITVDLAQNIQMAPRPLDFVYEIQARREE